MKITDTRIIVLRENKCDSMAASWRCRKQTSNGQKQTGIKISSWLWRKVIKKAVNVTENRIESNGS